MRKLLLAAAAALFLAPIAYADAASVSGTLTIVIAPPALAMVINPSSANEACEVPAGTVISQLSTTGGDGNAVTFSLSAGDTTDFVIGGGSNNEVVVAPAGINSLNCGQTETTTVQASQQ